MLFFMSKKSVRLLVEDVALIMREKDRVSDNLRARIDELNEQNAEVEINAFEKLNAANATNKELLRRVSDGEKAANMLLNVLQQELQQGSGMPDAFKQSFDTNHEETINAASLMPAPSQLAISAD